jgi:vacuolar-type H+-ATPase subunit E/Vma4
MRSLDENIESLSRAMLSEARADAEQILAEAKAKADVIRQKAQEQAAAERAEILERARQEAERLRGQVVATTQMKARTMELAHREKLLDGVFAEARKQLTSVEQYANYDEIAQRLLRESLAQLKPTKARFQADEKSLKVFTAAVLEEISKEMKVEQLIAGEPLKKGTGVLVESGDGHLVYDNTLETRLDRLQNNLRSPVYRILIGETL